MSIVPTASAKKLIASVVGKMQFLLLDLNTRNLTIHAHTRTMTGETSSCGCSSGRPCSSVTFQNPGRVSRERLAALLLASALHLNSYAEGCDMIRMPKLPAALTRLFSCWCNVPASSETCHCENAAEMSSTNSFATTSRL